MLSTVLLCLLSSVWAQDTHYYANYAATPGQNTCITCASPSLRSRWELTGLRRTLTDATFSADCNKVNGGTNAYKEACAGPCLTLMFDDPDYPSPTDKSYANVLFVRGCAHTLTGMGNTYKIPQATTTAPGTFCEFDNSHERPNNQGKMTAIRMLAQFCIPSTTSAAAGDACNGDRTLFPNSNAENACNGQTLNATVGGSSLDCYVCDEVDGNCKKNSCSKKYCTKNIVRMHDSYVMHKGCSNVNVLGVDNVCAASQMVASGIVPYEIKQTLCFCNDKQKCNGSPSTLLASLLAAIIALVTV